MTSLLSQKSSQNPDNNGPQDQKHQNIPIVGTEKCNHSHTLPAVSGNQSDADLYLGIRIAVFPQGQIGKSRQNHQSGNGQRSENRLAGDQSADLIDD